LSLPLRCVSSSTNSPATHRSSAAAAATAIFSTEGLVHKSALPADVSRRGFAKIERIGGRFNY
jgi:hypothetical protein